MAASANFPALLLALTWRRFNTTGAVTGVLVGTLSSIFLVIVSPGVWPGPDAEGSPIGWELANPGILSIPLGFIGCWIGTVLSGEEAKATRDFDELYVRSETGLGAEAGGVGGLRPQPSRAAPRRRRRRRLVDVCQSYASRTCRCRPQPPLERRRGQQARAQVGGRGAEPQRQVPQGVRLVRPRRARQVRQLQAPDRRRVDGKLKAVPRAVIQAAAVMQGARGGTKLPKSDIPRVRSHLARYCRSLGQEPPRESG